MNILLYDMASYIQSDLIYTLKKMGHKCRNILYHPNKMDDDLFFETKFEKIMKEARYDVVMSTNFFPIVSKVCERNQIKYLAWTYDSPLNIDDIIKYQSPFTYVFFFDRNECLETKKKGGIQMYHLPLAANTDRLDQISISSEEKKLFHCDVSFVGQLYDNYSQETINSLPFYYQGVLNALIDSQLKIYGRNIIKEAINKDLANDIAKNLDPITFNTETFNRKSITLLLLKEVTRRERLYILENLYKKIDCILYTNKDIPNELNGIRMPGSVDYFTQMPKVFKESTINLNISLRSIESGIPLRAIDIMGCGGLLMSNWQEEIAENFPNEEYCLYYSDLDEAIDKCLYYAKHKDLAQKIALKGYQKIKEEFNYPNRISEMFRIADL